MLIFLELVDQPLPYSVWEMYRLITLDINRINASFQAGHLGKTRGHYNK